MRLSHIDSQLRESVVLGFVPCQEAGGIDCLVCNAGAMTHKKTLTPEGHEAGSAVAEHKIGAV